MSVASKSLPLELPESLRAQLLAFRRRLWSVKLAEGLSVAASALLIAFLLAFVLDRFFDTPAVVRAGLLIAVIAGGLAVPLAMYRWVWRRRHPDQLARLLGKRHASIGDQLLGIIELVRSESEQARSRALCEAAIVQVADQARGRDFADAVPRPRHLHWGAIAITALLIAVLLGVLYPAASASVWARLLAPFGDTPRYTFTIIEPLPEQLVVAYGEPFTVRVALSDDSQWQPDTITAELPGQAPVTARRQDREYEIQIPAQLQSVPLTLRIGDRIDTVSIEPTMRPELTGVEAHVRLPEYLERSEPLKKDVRGGSITLVKGSQAAIAATASRELAEAKVNGQPVEPQGARLTSPPALVDAEQKIQLEWQDQYGLDGKEPFTIAVAASDDLAPTVSVQDLPRQQIVLESEQLQFTVFVEDDFGVKRVGLEWRGVAEATASKPAEGEKILAAGAPDRERLEVQGTFSAQSLGIEAQPLEVRLFAEDYLPGRERTYSHPFLLYVLTPEQHAIWLTEQLSKWHRQSLEVRDRELQLHEANKQLRQLSIEELDQPENRRRLEAQAAAERANGRRLSKLVAGGEDLVRQAMRNPEFGVGYIEQWAEMLQILKDISGNRMPSVAELLKEAAQAPVASATPASDKRMAGQNRANVPVEPAPSEPKPGAPKAVPQVVDIESSHGVEKRGDEDDNDSEKNGSKPSSPALRLPVTGLAGGGGKNSNSSPSAEKADQAIAEQRDLLAEFDKVADELNKVLANLEGSTLVKRLKAEARRQYQIAGRVADSVSDTFGAFGTINAGEHREVFQQLSDEQVKSSLTVSHIMDDMQAYFERRRFANFKAVLDDMRKQDVTGALRQLSDELAKEEGLSIAQCEYWSDTLDRWAEDLVDPSNCGQCPGAKSPGSLPPSIVLEVLKILEAEVNLREETRVAEQARAALDRTEYQQRADQLSIMQNDLDVRTVKVAERIRELPDAEGQFQYELQLLAAVSQVMSEATEILRSPDTGPRAIAAETEVIELLLQSRRFNPKGGGGGGSSPGGGGKGTTTDAALALVGRGINQNEVREDRAVGQATGQTGPQLPAEFRSGLDQYFHALEQGAMQP